MRHPKEFTILAAVLLVVSSGSTASEPSENATRQSSEPQAPAVRVLKAAKPPEDLREQAYHIQAQFEQELEEIKRQVRRLEKQRDQALRELFLDYPEIRRKLKQRVTIEFEGVPLREALRQLAEATGLNIVIDEQELEEIGISLDRFETTIKLKAIPLKAALEWMLEQHELTFFLERNVVLVTSTEYASAASNRRFYPVHDLVTPLPGELESSSVGQVVPDRRNDKGYGSGFFQVDDSGSNAKQEGDVSKQQESSLTTEAAETDEGVSSEEAGPVSESAQSTRFQELIRLIENHVEVDSWDPIGFGTIEIYERGKCLIVDQTPAVHEQVEDFLDRLRLAREMQTRIEIRRVRVKP